MAVDLIQIRNLKTYFFQGKGVLSKWFGQGLKIVHAVDDVSLTIKKESLCEAGLPEYRHRP